MSAGIGNLRVIAFTGLRNSEHWVHMEIFEGSYGGRDGKDGMDAAKKMKADNVLTEDQMHDLEKIVQEITDKHIKEIDAKVGDKEKEVMTV